MAVVQGSLSFACGYAVKRALKQCVKNALNSSWKDFEDAVQHESALQIAADYIVTRNSDDFKSSFIEVLSPHDFLTHFE